MEEVILVELAIFKPIFFKMTAQNIMMKDRAKIISDKAFLSKIVEFAQDLSNFLLVLNDPMLAL